MLTYLLRLPFNHIVKHDLYSKLMLVLIALIIAWTIPWIKIFRLNMFLVILCLLSLGSGLYSIISTENDEIVGSVKNESHRTLYDQITFIERPNIYYIVPDSYPNREGLKKIYNIDNLEFYQQLGSLDFTIYHSAYSNYMYSLASLSSLFSMRHNYYQNRVGNFEMLNAREFIAGKYNPVVYIFKNNGYQVHYLHESDYLIRKGCYVDLCSPPINFLGDFIEVLIPGRLKSHRLAMKKIIKNRTGLAQTVIKDVDQISTHKIPHFMYIHMDSPDHSPAKTSTVESLASFRKSYFEKIQNANGIILKFVQHILERDPGALIIINADHGSWGLGHHSFFEKEDLKGVPDDLITLDSLGVLLAIRWPGSKPKNDQDIRTNVNLFRYIFAYLSEREDIFATKVPDHGYIQKGRGKGSIVAKGIHEGNILKNMVEVDTVK